MARSAKAFQETLGLIVHSGAVEKDKLFTKKESMTLMGVKQLGLGMAGADLISSKNGPLLIEVNASPGLQGIEDATGINVAKEIILYNEKKEDKRRE